MLDEAWGLILFGIYNIFFSDGLQNLYQLSIGFTHARVYHKLYILMCCQI